MGVRMILTLTKVDLPMYWTLNVVLTVSKLLGFDPSFVLHTSVQLRKFVASMLDVVFWEVVPPSKLTDNGGITCRANVIDSWFYPLRGLICLVKVILGMIHYNYRVSIIEPLKNSETTAE